MNNTTFNSETLTKTADFIIKKLPEHFDENNNFSLQPLNLKNTGLENNNLITLLQLMSELHRGVTREEMINNARMTEGNDSRAEKEAVAKHDHKVNVKEIYECIAALKNILELDTTMIKDTLSIKDGFDIAVAQGIEQYLPIFEASIKKKNDKDAEHVSILYHVAENNNKVDSKQFAESAETDADTAKKTRQSDYENIAQELKAQRS